MSLRVRGQMSTLLPKSSEFSLFLAQSVQPYPSPKKELRLGPLLISRIELSHRGPGAQEDTKSGKDKGLLKVPCAAHFYSLQHGL